nr:hypothetical protein [Sphingopyxis italica]
MSRGISSNARGVAISAHSAAPKKPVATHSIRLSSAARPNGSKAAATPATAAGASPAGSKRTSASAISAAAVAVSQAKRPSAPRPSARQPRAIPAAGRTAAPSATIAKARSDSPHTCHFVSGTIISPSTQSSIVRRRAGGAVHRRASRGNAWIDNNMMPINANQKADASGHSAISTMESARLVVGTIARRRSRHASHCPAAASSAKSPQCSGA